MTHKILITYSMDGDRGSRSMEYTSLKEARKMFDQLAKESEAMDKEDRRIDKIKHTDDLYYAYNEGSPDKYYTRIILWEDKPPMKNLDFIAEDIYDRLAGNQGGIYTPLTPDDIEDMAYDRTTHTITITTTAKYNNNEKSGRKIILKVEREGA